MSEHKWTEQELVDEFEQMAAMREYDADMPRKQAERAAYYDWRKQFPNVIVPEAIRQKVRLSEKNNGT